MHRVARWRASHETPSALEPASFPRAGEARLVERDLGEDAFVIAFHERKRELRRVVIVEALRRVHPVPGVVVRLEFVGLNEQPIHATRDTAKRVGDESEDEVLLREDAVVVVARLRLHPAGVGAGALVDERSLPRRAVRGAAEDADAAGGPAGTV